MPRGLQPFVIALGLSLGLAVAHGLGVLAFALILPAMMADLGWTFWQAGLLGSCCAAGYAAGLVLVTVARGRVTPARLFQLGFIVAAATLVTTGATRDLAQLSILRFISGFAAAPMLVSGRILASAIYAYEPERAPRVVAIVEAGTGAGLILGSLIVPLVVQTLGAKGWPEAWLTLGLLASVSLPFGFWASQRIAVVRGATRPVRWVWWRFLPALAAYALFGASTLAILTFLVLRAQMLGANVYAIVAIWLTLGLAGILAPVFWQPLLARMSAGRKIACTVALTATGAALLAFAVPPSALVVAATLIGFGAFMVHATVMRLVEVCVPREAWGSAKAAFRVTFAVSQMAGPVVAGWLADHTGTLETPLILAAGTLALAALLALAQPVGAASSGGAPRGRAVADGPQPGLE